MSKYWNDHVHYLEQVEQGMYDENDHLDRRKIGRRHLPTRRGPALAAGGAGECRAPVVDDHPNRPGTRAGGVWQECRRSELEPIAGLDSIGRLANMEIRRVSLIAPKPTVPLGASHYLVMLFWGLPLIGTILKERGYEVRVFFEIVKPIDWDFVYSSQVVGFQTLACTATPHLRVHPAHQVQ